MKLFDYLMMFNDWVSIDVPDNEIDAVIAVDFIPGEADKIDEDFPYMDKFTTLLYKKVEINNLMDGGTPVCKFSDIINKNIELFKEHVKKHWKEEMQWVLDQDNIDAGEFAYEFIKEFDNVIGGRYPESVNKQYYELLSNCKE